MTRTSPTMLAAAVLIITATATPTQAAGSIGIHISGHGFTVGFGSSDWGPWGPSWGAPGWSIGFSTALSGYGEWIRIDGLGSVWRPWVAAGWQPYSHGRWVWTSLGWTWVAYEPWGWIPHHYGNWALTTVGWVWSPGYRYHPGNVVWVTSGPYIGWVPCAPHGWNHARRAYDHGWRDGYHQGYRAGWDDARHAVWVPRNQVTRDNLALHAVRYEDTVRSVSRGRVTPLVGPPTKTEVERDVGRPVPETRIGERRATIDGREVQVFRPEGLTTSVRRHGAVTVENALAESARERVSRDGGQRGRSTTAAPARVPRRPDTPAGTPVARTSNGHRKVTTAPARRPSETRPAEVERRSRSQAATTAEKAGGATMTPSAGREAERGSRAAPSREPRRAPRAAPERAPAGQGSARSPDRDRPARTEAARSTDRRLRARERSAEKPRPKRRRSN